MRAHEIVLVIIAAFTAVFLAWPSPAHSVCIVSYCKETTGPKRTYITGTHRRIVGDLYNPGTGRIQIRDTHRRIVGYIERSGRVTNLHRQKIGKINE